MVQSLNLLALLNPEITHSAIDGALFQYEVNALGILAIPSVYVGGKVFGQGRMDLGDILAKLDTTGGAAQAEGLTARAPTTC